MKAVFWLGIIHEEYFNLARLLSLLSAYHILSGCRKKFGVNYGQSPEMGP